MNRRPTVLLVALAVVLTWAGTTISTSLAQSRIPNGVFVRQSDGTAWLILNDQRVLAPVWNASDEEILSVPTANQIAVLKGNNVMAAQERAAWLADAAGPEEFEGSQITNLEGVAGQQAVGLYAAGAQRLLATVRTMKTARLLPSTKQVTDAAFFQVEDQWAAGKFVVVEVEVENIGTEPECCMPMYLLRDVRGRYFRGEYSDDDPKVRAAHFWLHPDVAWGNPEFEPHRPQRRVFVYDVPSDAEEIGLAADH